MYNARLFRQITSTRLGAMGAVPYWPEDLPYMKARWINGRRADDLWMKSSPYPPNSVLWNEDERKLAWNVAIRELYRLMGPPTSDRERLDRDDMVKRLLAAELAEDNMWHVFSSRPTNEVPDWRRWACFCNFYWWLAPADREELRKDLGNSGALWRWAPVAIDQMQPRCPVMDDPAYRSSTAVFLASENWANLLGSNAYAMPPGMKSLSETDMFPWPVVDASGNPVLPPWLSLPGPCSPFPQCLPSLWPSWLPQIPVDQLWLLLASWVAANPSQLRMIRSQEGGIYTAATPPTGRPPSPPVGSVPVDPVTGVPPTPSSPPKYEPFTETHTKVGDACRWSCTAESVDAATDAGTCQRYVDCVVRNDPTQAASAQTIYDHCLGMLKGQGVGFFVSQNAPEQCKAEQPAAATSWWSSNWKYVVGGGAALLGAVGLVALASRRPRAYASSAGERLEPADVGERVVPADVGESKKRRKAKPLTMTTVDPVYRARIEELAWAKLHRDFRSVIKGVRYMLYLNPLTGATELWPISAVPTSHLEWTAGLRKNI